MQFGWKPWKVCILHLFVYSFREIRAEVDLTIARRLSDTLIKLRENATDELYQGLPQQEMGDSLEEYQRKLLNYLMDEFGNLPEEERFSCLVCKKLLSRNGNCKFLPSKISINLIINVCINFKSQVQDF